MKKKLSLEFRLKSDIKNHPLSLPKPLKLKPHLWPFFTLLSFISAQATYSGSLSSKYAESSNDFNFSEHFFDGQINLGSWSAWSQLEFSEPPELGVDFSGLRKFKLEYLGDNFSLEMGDVYTIWGRGLILNQVDEILCWKKEKFLFLYL